MKHFFVVLAACVLVLLPITAYGQPPQIISLQGFLSSSDVPLNGTFDLTLSLYDPPTGGSPLWTEIHNGVPVQDGLFSVILGSIIPFPASLFDAQRYLEMTALAGPGITSAITFPRTQLTSAPYSLAPWASNGSKIYYNSGNVGIGTTTPDAKVHIKNHNPLIVTFEAECAATQTAPIGLFRSGSGATKMEITSALAEPTCKVFKEAGQTGDYVRYVDDQNNIVGGVNSSGQYFGNGSGLTNLNASNLSTGNVADGRLSSNVALRNAANTFAAACNFQSTTDMVGFRLRALDPAASVGTFQGTMGQTGALTRWLDNLGNEIASMNGTGGLRCNGLTPSGTTMCEGNVTLGDASTDNITCNGTEIFNAPCNWSSGATCTFDDNIVAHGNATFDVAAILGNARLGTTPSELLIEAGSVITADWSGVVFKGIVTLGNAAADNITCNGTWTSNEVSTFNNTCMMNSGGAGNRCALFRGASGQTAPLWECQDDASTAVASCDGAGALTCMELRTNRCNVAGPTICNGGVTTTAMQCNGQATIGGDCNIGGTLTANVKNFEIDHPTDPNKKLIHSVLEGPEVAVFYRGEGQLSDGKATITLPSYVESLTRKSGRTVLLTSTFENEDEEISALAASAVRDGKFSVRALDAKNPSQKFFWEVKAVRADVPALLVEN